MAFVSIDLSNSLVVHDAYEQRTAIADLGGYWDAQNKAWRIVFTIANLEALLDAIPDISTSEDLAVKVKDQMDKEAKLEKLRVMSKQDTQVCLRIPGMKLSLYNYQRLGVMYAATNRVGLLLADEMGLGKGTTIDSQVFTTFGKVRIGSLKVGDEVVGKDGKPHNVIGVYPQGMREVYRVWFNDGFYLDVDSSHLWEVRSNNQHSKVRKTSGVVLSMEQLLDKDGVAERVGEGRNSGKTYKFKTYYKKTNGNNSWGIPMVDPIQFVHRTIDIDPYLLGVWLGDGHIMKTGYVNLVMLKADLADMNVGGKIGRVDASHMEARLFNTHKQELVNLGLNGKRAWEKFIPDDYKYNSEEVRLAVIQGLMDTDGHASDCATEYSTSSKQLCDDVVEIVQTLGGIARVRSRIPRYWYKGVKKTGRTSYSVNIKLPPSIVPFRLPRKVVDYDKCDKYSPERYICNIEKLAEKKETVCISVDAPDNLYVTEHCIVTHNTLQAIGTAMFLKASDGAKKALIVTPASLKFNWPLEIEKFTDEKYVVIDGTPDERVAQWLRDDVFFYVVNFELLLEDLFGGRKFREKKGESDEDRQRRLDRHEKISTKAKQRRGILTTVRNRVWDVIAVDECFPYGTMIETDKGRMSIGDVVSQKLPVSVLSCDFSRNVSSYRRVVRWMEKSMSGHLVEVTHERGSFVCTWNHKIWTDEWGYIKAGEATKYGEAHLRVLPSRVRCTSQGEVNTEILFGGLFRKIQTDVSGHRGETSGSKNDAKDSVQLYGMRSRVCGQDDKRAGEEILFEEVCGDLEVKNRGSERQNVEDAGGLRVSNEGKAESEILQVYDREESRPGIPTEGDGGGSKVEGDTSIISCEGRETIHNEAAEIVGGSSWRRMGDGIQGLRQENGRCVGESTSVLSDRHCKCGNEDCCRGGRKNPQDDEVEDNRCSEGEGFVLSRLESIKVLERRDFERLGLGSPENLRVYNLEVEADTDDDHCYVADGVLVSNCQALKHHSSTRTQNVLNLKAKCRMALTGTPMDGRLEELHSLMQFVAPGLLMSKTRFFQRHVETDFWGRVTGYKRMGEVSQKIQQFFLRRLKRDVLKDLPDKVYENRLVSLTAEEHKIYKALAEQGHEATEDVLAVVSVIRCKQFCNYPQMVDASCTTTSKMDSFREVLDEVVVQNGHKALVFSQYKEMLNILVPELEKMGIKYMRIDGDTPPIERASMQKKFNEDKSLDVMIGTEAMSTGLNFQSADYVINYDDNWSPAIMAQREDRCHRNGQRNVVTVVNFICRDTIEERIRGVIYAKNRVTAQVLGDETDDMVLRRLGPKDVCQLL